eukprot:SAG25_NODE_13606_length_265_cov_0.626506_1_plen_24_part_10
MGGKNAGAKSRKGSGASKTVSKSS